MAEVVHTHGGYDQTVSSLAGGLSLSTEELKDLLSANNINRNMKKRWPDRPPVHTSDGMTLLQRAVQQQLWEFLPWLIQQGADVYHKDPKKGACTKGSMIVHLLMYYFDTDPPPQVALDELITPETINSGDKNDDRPLHVAAYMRNWKFVQMLIEYGADIEAVNRDGKTPLHMALSELYRRREYSLVEVVALLISPQTVNKKSLQNLCQATPIQYALNRKLWNTLPVLVVHGASLSVNKRNFLFR